MTPYLVEALAVRVLDLFLKSYVFSRKPPQHALGNNVSFRGGFSLFFSLNNSHTFRKGASPRTLGNFVSFWDASLLKLIGGVDGR